MFLGLSPFIEGTVMLAYVHHKVCCWVVWIMSLHGATNVLMDKLMMSKDEVFAVLGYCVV